MRQTPAKGWTRESKRGAWGPRRHGTTNLISGAPSSAAPFALAGPSGGVLSSPSHTQRSGPRHRPTGPRAARGRGNKGGCTFVVLVVQFNFRRVMSARLRRQVLPPRWMAGTPPRCLSQNLPLPPAPPGPFRPLPAVRAEPATRLVSKEPALMLPLVDMTADKG